MGKPGWVESGELQLVPMFPLPNVVLFPRAVLPLHIFEERYKLMTRHALEGDGQVAMALLQPGWQKCYYSRPAIEPVVCVGTIVAHERLPDGCYNFLLHGHTRARVVREVRSDEPYRLAMLAPLAERCDCECQEELAAAREHLREIFTEGPFAPTVLGRQFSKLIDTPLTTPELVDLISFNFLEDVPFKQSLLADLDVRRRVARALEAFEELRPVVKTAVARSMGAPGMN